MCEQHVVQVLHRRQTTFQVINELTGFEMGVEGVDVMLYVGGVYMMYICETEDECRLLWLWCEAT